MRAVALRLGEVGAREPADRVDGQRAVPHQRREGVPAQPVRPGVRGGRLHRPRRPRSRGPAPRPARSRAASWQEAPTIRPAGRAVAGHERARGEVHAVGLRQAAAVAVHDDERAEGRAARERAREQELHALRLQPLLADLDEQPLAEHLRREPERSSASKPVSAAFETTITAGSASAASTGALAGSIGRDVVALEPLPGDGLVLERLRLAVPGRHAEEMQPHRRVRVGVDARDPRRGLAHGDAELLLQLPRRAPRARSSPGSILPPGNSQ